MEFFVEFMIMALTALSIENAIFTRALGIGKSMFTVKSTRQILIYGGMVTFTTTLASALCSPLSQLSAVRAWGGYYRSLLFLVVLCALYVVFLFFMRLLPQRIAAMTSGFLPLAFFNCAAFGSVMLCSFQAYDFAQFTGFGFGTGVGFTVAYLLVVEGRRRSELSSVPKAFRGFPATVMYIGILSLAFYGLTGHQLPI